MKRGLATGCGLALMAPALFLIGIFIISYFLVRFAVHEEAPEGASVHIIAPSGFNISPGGPWMIIPILMLFVSGIIVLVRYGRSEQATSRQEPS